MKRANKLYALLGVLVVACLVTFGVTKAEQHKEAIKNSGEVVLRLDSDTVTALSWKNETDSLSFHKTGEDWFYDDDEAFPVEEKQIDSLFGRFQEFAVAFVIDEVEDISLYGLDKPVCTIEIETPDKTHEILLGDYSKMDSQRYVSIGDGKVYLVQDDPLEYFDATLRDMIANDFTPDFETVQKVNVAGADTYELTFREDSTDSYCAEDVYFTEKDGEILPLDTALVDGYLRTVSGLTLTDYVTYKASAEELSKYGMDDPQLTVTVDYTNQDEDKKEVTGTLTLHVSQDPEEKKKAEESDSDEEQTVTAYARVGDSKIIYKITADEYESLMKATRNDLRHQEVLSADFADVNGIDISLDGASYTITSQEEKDEKTYFYGEEELQISDLRTALTALTATSFTDEQPAQKEEIGLTVHLDNENFPEVKIQLYRYDGSDCLAVVDGKPVCLVKRSQVIDLVEAVNAIVLN